MQVLAVTGNASLVVALGSMMRDWEVVTVRSADEAIEQGSPSMIALIDMGETNDGIEIADSMYRRGLVIPGVVIGDVAIEHPRVTVLVRPFSLEDLSAAVRGASERPLARPASEPFADTPAPKAGVTTSEGVASANTVTAEHLAPQSPAEPALRRQLSVVRPPETDEVELPPAAPQPAEAPPATFDETAAAAVETSTDRPDVESEQVPEPEFVAEPESIVFEEANAESIPSGPAPVQPASEDPAWAPTPAEPAESRWRGFRRKGTRVDRPAASVAAPEEPPFMRQLKTAAKNLRDLGTLLEELPVLDDLRSMADALVGEVDSMFEPQTTAVFVPTEDGFHPIAHRGLSRVEAGMVVPYTQPMFSDVVTTRDGILIQPVDLAQGLVAGIGGARTESMMASPAVLDDEVVAVVVVGSEHFEESDLDRLSEIAAEAAPGLAVAIRIEDLRSRGGIS